MAEEFHLKQVIWVAFSGFFWGATLPLLVIVAVFVFHFLNPYCCSRFDDREWKMAGASDWETAENDMKCVRGGMLTDLRLRHLKAGMRKEELFSLLGPATQSLDDRAKGCFTYRLGYCRGLGFSLDFVKFCFGADGHVLNGNGEVR
jgi:hypothetical protein